MESVIIIIITTIIICFHLYSWYLHLYGVQSVAHIRYLTIYGTCCVTSHAEYLYFDISTFRNTCAVPSMIILCIPLCRPFHVYYYYYYHHHHHHHRISHFSALAVKYSPILCCSNQQD